MTFIKSDYYEYSINDTIVPSMFTTLHPRNSKLSRALNLYDFALPKESSRFCTIVFSICVANIVLARILDTRDTQFVVKL
jgi:hypothetical protein